MKGQERQYRKIPLIDFSSFKNIFNINNDQVKSSYEEIKENVFLEKNDDAINDFRDGIKFVFLNLKNGHKFNINIRESCNFDLLFSLNEREENIFLYHTTLIDQENNNKALLYLQEIDKIKMNQLELKEEDEFKWKHSDLIKFKIIKNDFLQFIIKADKGIKFGIRGGVNLTFTKLK